MTGSSCFIRNASRFPCNWNGTSVSSVSSSKSVAIGSFIPPRLPSSCLLSPGTHCERLTVAKVANVFNDDSRFCPPLRLLVLRVPRIFHSPLIHEPRELNTCALNCRPSASFGSLWIVGPSGSVHRSAFAAIVEEEDRVSGSWTKRTTTSSWNFLRLKFSFGCRDSKAFEICNSQLWFSWKSSVNFQRGILSARYN